MHSEPLPASPIWGPILGDFEADKEEVHGIL
jgi:hypothetical protein